MIVAWLNLPLNGLNSLGAIVREDFIGFGQDLIEH